MPDAIFDHPRVARVYDPLDPDRSDLDTYVDLVAVRGPLGSRLVTERGLQVFGVDPAGASVDVARTKPGGETG